MKDVIGFGSGTQVINGCMFKKNKGMQIE